MSVVAEVKGLRKVYGRSVVLDNVAFTLNLNETLLITGRNGSGKSTLSKILVDLLSPSSGKVSLLPEQTPESRHLTIGFVAPYVQLFEEFTALEHLELVWKLRQCSYTSSSEEVLDQVGLAKAMKKSVRAFSSGMKQRLKYAIAIVHRPSLLVLDEPMANLDDEGMEIVRRIMSIQTTHGALVVATNNPGEMEQFSYRLNLDDR